MNRFRNLQNKLRNTISTILKFNENKFIFLVLTIAVVVTSILRLNQKLTFYTSAVDGAGGWCNPNLNSGCYGADGCRDWERCDRTRWVCIDTTNLNTKPPDTDACKYTAQKTFTPTPEPTSNILPSQNPATVAPTQNQTQQNLILRATGESCQYNNSTFQHGYCTITSSKTGSANPEYIFLFCDRSRSTNGWNRDSDGNICTRYNLQTNQKNTTCLGIGTSTSNASNCCSGVLDKQNRCSLNGQTIVTPTPLPQTATPSPTLETVEPTLTPTSISIPTNSPTPIKVETTYTPQATFTPVPTMSFTPIPTRLPSNTPTPTHTTTPTITPSTTPTATLTPTTTPSFTPTNTPTVIPSSTPTSIPTPTNTHTPTVTQFPTATLSISQGNRCSDYGMGLFDPQMRLLGRELCSNGRVVVGFDKSTPANLKNVKEYFNSIGTGYIGWANTRVVPEVAEGLRQLEAYMSGTSQCIPYITYGFRTYEEQEQIFNNNNCVWDEKLQMGVVRGTTNYCGAQRPGYSIHQSGLAVDIFCGNLINNGGGNYSFNIDYSKNLTDYISKEKLLEFGFIHPIAGDPPHFHFYK